MPNLKDLTGFRFGRLVVLRRAPDRRRGWPRWLCLCDCGNEKEVDSNNLRNNNTRSCGCLNTIFLEERVKNGLHWTHRLSTSPLYKTWNSMRQRCENPKSPSFHNYGGRGIYVCERWRNFANFAADMAPKPSPQHSIDRIDNDGPYSPENCRWVGSRQEQMANRRVNRPITFRGETHIVAEWARRVNIDQDTLLMRLKSGWSVERALTTPLNYKLITFEGETKTVGEWSTQTGISRRTITDRLRKGWPPQRILAKS